MKEFNIVKYDVVANKNEVIPFILDIVVNEFKIDNLTEYYQFEFIDFIKELPHQFYVAKDNDKIIGICGYFESSEKEARLSSFYVDSNYRSFKVGKNLFDACINDVKDKDYESIILRTSSVFDKAIKFYERNNFVLYKETDKLWYRLVF